MILLNIKGKVHKNNEAGYNNGGVKRG